VPMVAV